MQGALPAKLCLLCMCTHNVQAQALLAFNIHDSVLVALKYFSSNIIDKCRRRNMVGLSVCNYKQVVRETGEPVRGRSHLTTSLPTSLHFISQEGCRRCDQSHIPAARIEKCLGWALGPPPKLMLEMPTD